ncbi:auxin-responsive protein SAUR72-like [Cornus florida]|uniref:auxin-responsive protein SAUR72-like n=1 Tax=Cornus florida TaxID=4283 RepID=UPI0028982F54|nr:auxin-responsive protein SAUR72-like [Cornus florida]
MDVVKKRGKKNLILKAWQRCRSIHGSLSKSLAMNPSSLSKSNSWHSSSSTSTKRSSSSSCKPAKSQVAPEGCFSVYVGPEKQRFVIKTKYANHPLFKMLLEDAELEYGYNSDGPILLPCDVHLFYSVLAEMDSKDHQISPRCGFSYALCSPFNPSRRLGNSDMAKGYGSYGILTPSRLLKMN